MVLFILQGKPVTSKTGKNNNEDTQHKVLHYIYKCIGSIWGVDSFSMWLEELLGQIYQPCYK